jgi:hypothetical protein
MATREADQQEFEVVTDSIIVRSFSGSQLYLTDISQAARFYRWSSDRTKAVAFESSIAWNIYERASREYGADCAIQDATGTMAKPSSVTDAERVILSALCFQNHVHKAKFVRAMRERGDKRTTYKLERVAEAYETEKMIEQAARRRDK